MAEASRFWTTNGTGDGPAGGYTAQQFYDFIRKLLITDQPTTQGVIFGEQNQLAVTGSASPLSANTGSAIVYGLFYENTSTVNLSVTTPTIGTTGGRVNLKADWTAQTIRLVANRNTDGNASLPSLTQTPGSVYELPLYTFSITTGGVITLTDVRTFIKIGSQIHDDAVLTASILNNAVTDAKLRTSGALSVIGRSANSTGNVADISAGSDNYVLRRSGTTLGFGQIVGAGIANDTITYQQLANRTRSFLVPVFDPNDSGSQYPGFPMPDGVASYCQGTFSIPMDYASDLTIDFLVHSPATTGNMYRRCYIYLGQGVGYSPNGVYINSAYTAISLPGPSIVKSMLTSSGVWSGYDNGGALVSWGFARDATSGSDTLNNMVIFMGILVTYTANS